jgi:hypothetical protein
LVFLRNYTIYRLDELGNELVSIDSQTLDVAGLHHEVRALDNGNFLTMSYTFRDVDYGGPQQPTHVAGDLLLEVTPAGEIVWQWDGFDHLDPLRTKVGFEETIVDPGNGVDGHDWAHGNALVYEPDTDTVLYSMRHQDWIIRIDRQTDEILWRFGDEGDFSLDAGTWQHHQHSPEWQEDGSLLMYDNGLGDPDVPDFQEKSRAVRYAIDFDTMTATQVWESAGEDFMSPIAGDADGLADGSVLITDGSKDANQMQLHGRVRKVDVDAPDTPTWQLTTDVGSFIYRCANVMRLPGEQP